jgi:hypothetical protein
LYFSLLFGPVLTSSCSFSKLESVSHHQGVDMHLRETDYCKLYDTIVASKCIESVKRYLQISILTDLQCLAIGVSPLTTDPIESSYDSDGSNSSQTASVMHVSNRIANDEDYRMKKLGRTYTTIPISFTKAKAAYLLSLYHFNELSDSVTGEQLAYECLYILDDLTQFSKNTPAILTTLGYNALRLFGELLLYNRKFSFAICSFEAAMKNLEIRGKERSYTQLSSMAIVCAEHQDWARALYYYQETLRICMREAKGNEVVHLSLLVFDILCEQGDYIAAERILVDSINYTTDLPSELNRSVTLSPNLRTAASQASNLFRMESKLVDMYGLNGHTEKSVDLLESVASTVALPKLGTVCLALAKAYHRKQWSREAWEILSLLRTFKGETILNTIAMDIPNTVSSKVVAQLRQRIPPGHSIDLSQDADRKEAQILAISCLCSMFYFPEAAEISQRLYDEFKDQDMEFCGRVLSCYAKELHLVRSSRIALQTTGLGGSQLFLKASQSKPAVTTPLSYIKRIGLRRSSVSSNESTAASAHSLKPDIKRIRSSSLIGPANSLLGDIFKDEDIVFAVTKIYGRALTLFSSSGDRIRAVRCHCK